MTLTAAVTSLPCSSFTLPSAVQQPGKRRQTLGKWGGVKPEGLLAPHRVQLQSRQVVGNCIGVGRETVAGDTRNQLVVHLKLQMFTDRIDKAREYCRAIAIAQVSCRNGCA